MELPKATKTTEEVDVVVVVVVFKVPSFTIDYRCADGKTTDEKEKNWFQAGSSTVYTPMFEK